MSTHGGSRNWKKSCELKGIGLDFSVWQGPSLTSVRTPELSWFSIFSLKLDLEEMRQYYQQLPHAISTPSHFGCSNKPCSWAPNATGQQCMLNSITHTLHLFEGGSSNYAQEGPTANTSYPSHSYSTPQAKQPLTRWCLLWILQAQSACCRR